MTTPRSFTRGSGQTAYRLQIEGSPYEAVSHRDMELTTGGRTRYAGLNTASVAIKEATDLVLAKWEPEGFRVTLVDRDKRWTELFDKAPTAKTYFDDSAGDDQVTAAETTIPVKSTAAFPSAGRIWIDTEVISYTGTTSTTFTGCSRGQFGTLAQYHYSADGERQRNPEVTNWPEVWAGRRAYLYAYSAGDSKTNTSSTAGHLIFTGVVASEPAYNGTAWSFRIEALSKKLDQSLGADLADPTPIRGIYYPASAPLYVYILEHAGANASSTATHGAAIYLAGFWEDQSSFLASLNGAIASALVAESFTQTDVGAIPYGASWALRYVATATKHMWCKATSAVDAIRIDGPQLDPDSGGMLFSDVILNHQYICAQPEPFGTVPRATVGSYVSAPEPGYPGYETGIDIATNPGWRVYLGGAAGITANTSRVAVDWPSNGPEVADYGRGPAPLTEPFTAVVTAVDTTARHITLSRPRISGSLAGGTGHYSACGGDVAQIRMGRDYGEGHLGDLIDTIVGDTAQYLNTGAVPDLRSTDFEAMSSTDIPAAAAASPLGQRGYMWFAPVKLSDLIGGECQILGVFPAYSANGKITFRSLRLPTLSEAAAAAITVKEVRTDKRYLSWSKNTLGLFGSVILETGYNPVEGAHEGRTYTVVDAVTRGKSPDAQSVTIAPLSLDMVRPDLSMATLHAQKLLGTFGGPYSLLDIDVSLRLFASVFVGDVVSVTWPKVPAGDGTLGVTSRIGWVISRQWEPRKARGRMTLMMTTQRVAGYTPSSKITSIVGTSGTTGPFTLSLSSDYFRAGETADDHFVAGDLVRLFRWNDASVATNVLATVDSVAANALVVTTGSAWTHAGSTWVVGYQPSTSITAANQKLYAFIANADATLDFSGDTGLAPFTHGP